jgi:tetratricopeptide (TPR) repeat protein
MIEDNQVSFGEERTSKIENISRYILVALVFLLPIFFIPGQTFPVSFSKLMLVSVGVMLSFSLWIISRLRAGNFKLPKHLVFYSAGFILLFGLVSTLFSGSIMESFIGVGGETNTFFFTLVLFTLFLVSFKIFRSPEKVLNLYFLLLISFLVLVVYQILRLLVGVDFLDFGLLNSATSTPIGRWNDLGILSGLSILLSLVTLEFFKSTKVLKILLYVLMALALLLVIVVNSLLTWAVLAVLALFLFVYLFFPRSQSDVKTEDSVSSEMEYGVPQKKVRRFSILSISIIVIATVFILLRSEVGGFISNKYNISQIEARPSLTSTLKVAQATLNQSPGFGAGPNRFGIEWGLHKPIGVNSTIFWNVNFNYGIGVIPTFLVTNGVLGFSAWVVFLGAILALGLKSLFGAIKDQVSRFVTISSLFGTVYLWTFSVMTVPGTAILSLTFLMTGIFMASIVNFGFIKYRDISFSDDSRVGFISVFSLVVVLIMSIGFIYLVGTRYISSVYAQKSLIEVNQNGDLEKGFKNLNRSLALAKTDSGHRLMAQIHVARLNVLLNDQSLAGTEEGTKQFQDVLGLAILSAQSATKIDSADYRNWLALGNIYEAIVPLGVQGAYESAKATYERARKENPTNPAVDLALARLEVSRGDNTLARIEITNSLRKKNNYTDAIFLLSQIEINEGNIAEATKAVEAASIINPNDSLTFFQLGFLKFNQSNFEGAITALERAVILNQPYSNAKYFLGLSYYNVGRVEDAVLQFEDVLTLNPDNREVKLILENLKAGNQPFLNLETPSPETREELPVQPVQPAQGL